MYTAPTAALLPTPAQPAAAAWWQRLGQTLTALWHPSREPRVTPLMTQTGELWYRAYNPQTGETQWLTSYEEVLVWLDCQPSL